MIDLTAKRPFAVAIDPKTPDEAVDNAVYAIGNFDGLHRGHKAVLEAAKSLAARSGRPSAVLTFEPHPSDFFGGPGTIFRLTPLVTKIDLVRQFGMDGIVALTFDAALAGLAAEAFVEQVLVRRLNVSAIVAGYDFHFGAKRGGTPAFLTDAGRRHGFAVEIVSRVEHGGESGAMAASSTATRQTLEQGDVAAAARMLGHFFSITGIVGHGQQLGRKLGFPTANMQADPSCRLRYGIYAVQARIEGQLHPAVASWGRRPSVDNGLPLLEAYLLDFSGDLYGQRLDCFFIDWLRAEERFESLEALVEQMHRDVEHARRVLSAAAPMTPELLGSLP